MSDFFNGLSDPTTIPIDSVDGGFYDWGSWNTDATDTNFAGGSTPAPLSSDVATPDLLTGPATFAAAPSLITDAPKLPAPGGTLYGAYAGANADPSSYDPLETPPSAVQSMANGGAHTGAIWSAIGTGGGAAVRVLSQGPTQIPSNPRGVQTAGLYVPQGIPSQSLQPTVGARLGAGATGFSASGVLLIIAIGVLLVWIGKR